MSWKCL